MNGPGDIPLTLSSTPENNPCSLISIIPTLGMSSCRGRAEAFARRLSSKLRTLGSQTDDESISPEDEPIVNGSPVSTWLPPRDSEQAVTALQPLRHESDSFFDFDCELESPGSPVDECEYLRLIETASNTPHNSAAESGYVCTSAASSHSSADAADAAFLDAINLEEPTDRRTNLSVSDLPDYASSLKINGSIKPLTNGFDDEHIDDTTVDACEVAVFSEDQLDHHSTETTDKLSTAVLNVDKSDKTEGIPISELSTKEQIRVQNDIITELQKKSADVTAEVDNSADVSDMIGEVCEKPLQTTFTAVTTITTITSTTRETTSPKETPAATKTPKPALEAAAAANETPHTVSNGHAENGKDENLLKIDVVAIEINPKDLESSSEEAEKQEVVENENNESGIPPESKPKENSRLSTLDTTDDEDDCRPQRVRRCSSLKTGKTPPGTPGRKKIVRFADVLGLDLADVKTFLDEIPNIPKSAFEDLEILESEPPMQLGPKSDKMLMPLFQQPGGLPTFLDIVREKQVSLENAAVTDSVNQTITGTVRVRNLDFHKSVHVRYSLDGWRSFADLQANYVDNSCDGFSDKFSFIIFGNSMQVGQRLEFAVRFQCKGQQFWDCNYGANYCFQCLPTSNPISHPVQPIVPSHHTNPMVSHLSPSVGEAWCSSFY